MLAVTDQFITVCRCDCGSGYIIATWILGDWHDGDGELTRRGEECPQCHVIQAALPGETEVRVWKGLLPRCLEGGDWTKYGVRGAGYLMTTDWDNWCRMWLGIAWVRQQGFWRDGDAEAAAEDLE